MIFNNDRMSWMGESSTCQTEVVSRKATVYTCVKDTCASQCCDCGNGHARPALAMAMQDDNVIRPTRSRGCLNISVFVLHMNCILLFILH